MANLGAYWMFDRTTDLNLAGIIYFDGESYTYDSKAVKKKIFYYVLLLLFLFNIG